MKSTNIKFAPLTGPYDCRSEPEQVPKDGYREVKNFAATGIGGRLCRAPGWTRLFPGKVNADLHDQLLDLQIYYDKAAEDTDDSAVTVYPPDNATFGTYCGTTLKTRSQGRQPITFTKQVESSSATRKLIVGTQSRLYALNERGGNHRIIGDGFGGETDDPSIRWSHARVGDYQFFTNDYDEVMSWLYDAPVMGCEMQAVKPIPELATIGLTKAKVILEFRGILILANVEQDGVRLSNKVIWSGFGKPFEWIEDPGVSMAGFEELDYGEEVLAGGVIGNFAYLYTTRGIWKMAVSEDPAIVFNFTKVYASDTGEACIKYAYTFASIGDAHIYMGEDGIYTWSQYSPRPDRLEWIHRASKILYDGINDTNCAAHTAFYSPKAKKLRFSVALGTDTLPSVTLVCDMQYRHAYKEDFGWAAGCEYVPDDRPSLKEWLIENCLLPASCFSSTPAREMGAYDPKEGTPTLPNPTCADYPVNIHTDQPLDVAGVTTEDYNQPSPSILSMCYRIGSTLLNALCRKCDSSPVLIGAAADDWCLKQIGSVTYRQRHTGNGVYVNDPYESRLLKCFPGNSQAMAITNVLLQYTADVQTPPLQMNLKVGASVRAEDPLVPCGIQWVDEGGRNVNCLDDDKTMEWNVWAADSFLYLDFTLNGIGGNSCYSSLEIKIQPTC